MLEITNLHASIEDDGTEILKGINLSVGAGDSSKTTSMFSVLNTFWTAL